jgi:hypothetical protein
MADITYIGFDKRYVTLVAADSLQLGNEKYAAKLTFKPIDAGTPSKGIYAAVPVPLAGDIGSIAVRTRSGGTAGQVVVSTSDPSKNYDAACLAIFLEDVKAATVGSAMYRKTEIHTGTYSTIGLNEGILYLLIIGGATVETIADVTMVIHSY